MVNDHKLNVVNDMSESDFKFLVVSKCIRLLIDYSDTIQVNYGAPYGFHLNVHNTRVTLRKRSFERFIHLRCISRDSRFTYVDVSIDHGKLWIRSNRNSILFNEEYAVHWFPFFAKLSLREYEERIDGTLGVWGFNVPLSARQVLESAFKGTDIEKRLLRNKRSWENVHLNSLFPDDVSPTVVDSESNPVHSSSPNHERRYPTPKVLPTSIMEAFTLGRMHHKITHNLQERVSQMIGKLGDEHTKKLTAVLVRWFTWLGSQRKRARTYRMTLPSIAIFLTALDDGDDEYITREYNRVMNEFAIRQATQHDSVYIRPSALEGSVPKYNLFDDSPKKRKRLSPKMPKHPMPGALRPVRNVGPALTPASRYPTQKMLDKVLANRAKAHQPILASDHLLAPPAHGPPAAPRPLHRIRRIDEVNNSEIKPSVIRFFRVGALRAPITPRLEERNAPQTPAPTHG
jgi:hypothetical protein